MLSVTIAINGKTLFHRSACRVDPLIEGDSFIEDEDICTYKVDDGTTIEHRFGDGAVALAKKLIDKIVEVK